MNKHGHSRAFSQSRKLTLNFYRSLGYACGSESIIYFTYLCKPIETYIYAMKKSTICKSSPSKTPKTQQICHYRHTRKTGDIFLLFNMGVDFSLRNNFANSGCFAKVSVPVHIYNSLIFTILNLELFTYKQQTR